MIEAAKKRPEILVQVGLKYRYMPPVAKLLDIVHSGKLGHVKMVAIREHRFPFLVKVKCIPFSVCSRTIQYLNVRSEQCWIIFNLINC